MFAAYSGDTPYRNQPGCIDYAGRGPLPIGRYWIVSRLSSG
ncbi:tlde1 domain-containing protein [Enterobacillus tribolii]